MSISAQVDTASIDVSLDMHQLRTEISEVLSEEFNELMQTTSVDEHVHINKRIDALTKRVDNAELTIKNLIQRVADLESKEEQSTEPVHDLAKLQDQVASLSYLMRKHQRRLDLARQVLVGDYEPEGGST